MKSVSGIEYKIGILFLAVAVSGCASVANNGQPQAKLIGEVSDSKITTSDPGEIKLNAMNYRNSTDFTVKIRPSGDYSKIAKITDRNGNEIIEVDLGTAVKEATTGQQFVQVRKKLNVTSTVEIKAELYNETSKEPLDTEIYTLRAVED